ncbi:MAG: glycosyltransferase family 4 protein [Cyanobacteria bacterium J06600_6]
MQTLQIGMGWFPERAGGLNRYYYDCNNNFAAAGIGFDGLVAGSENANKYSQQRVRAFANSNVSLLKRWLGVRKNFKNLTTKQHYDVIVSHFAFYAFPLLNLLQDRPLVTHFHGPWALESDVESSKSLAVKAKKWLEQKTYQRSQEFIVLSQTFRDVLHQEYAVPLEKINVIPGGVDLEYFNIQESKQEARQKLGWDTNKTVIFCIRRLARRMGLENLIAAMSEVCQQYPDTLLYIGGKGELADSLQTQIVELGLVDNIKLLGYVADEDLPLCYRAANFSIVPTVALEGFGLIVIESLATGTPVLGTPIGGIPEILRPFSPNLVLESPAAKDIAAGITETLSGRRQLPDSHACIDHVKNNYTWDVIAPKIKTVYEQALKNYD